MRTNAQARREKHELRRQIAAEHKRADRQKLADLRAAIKAAKASRKDRMRAAVDRCREVRRDLRAQAKQFRAARAAETKAILSAGALDARGSCGTSKELANAGAAAATAEAKVAYKSERAYQRAVRRNEADARRALRREAKKERANESDDEVRQNVPAELHAYFDQVKRHVKRSDRQSRTEAFLRMAEENPGDVLDAQGSDVEREVARLVKEHAEHQKAMHHPRRYAELSPAPF